MLLNRRVKLFAVRDCHSVVMTKRTGLSPESFFETPEPSIAATLLLEHCHRCRSRPMTRKSQLSAFSAQVRARPLPTALRFTSTSYGYSVSGFNPVTSIQFLSTTWRFLPSIRTSAGHAIWNCVRWCSTRVVRHARTRCRSQVTNVRVEFLRECSRREREQQRQRTGGG